MVRAPVVKTGAHEVVSSYWRVSSVWRVPAWYGKLVLTMKVSFATSPVSGSVQLTVSMRKGGSRTTVNLGILGKSPSKCPWSSSNWMCLAADVFLQERDAICYASQAYAWVRYKTA